MRRFRQTTGGRGVAEAPPAAPGFRKDWPAISCRQPWAWMLMTQKFHRILRPYGTMYRGPILIHAGSVLTDLDWYNGQDYARNHMIDLPPAIDLPRGGVVAAAFLTDCRDLGLGRFSMEISDLIVVPFFRCSGDFEVFEIQGGRPCCFPSNETPRGRWQVCQSCGWPLGFT